MPSMDESLAIPDLADHLYEYLTGNPHSYADPEISFPRLGFQAGYLPTLTKLLSEGLYVRVLPEEPVWTDLPFPLICSSEERNRVGSSGGFMSQEF